MAEDSQNTKVVKVRPYPIHCQLKRGESGTPVKCEIMRLELVGFIFKTNNHYFKTGDEYICDFELPVFHKRINESVKIIKTYETATGGAERPIMVEVHFKDQFHKNENFIRQFISKIGQKSA